MITARIRVISGYVRNTVRHNAIIQYYKVLQWLKILTPDGTKVLLYRVVRCFGAISLLPDLSIINLLCSGCASSFRIFLTMFTTFTLYNSLKQSVSIFILLAILKIFNNFFKSFLLEGPNHTIIQYVNTDCTMVL